MLTVLNINKRAISFYMTKCGYVLDKISPDYLSSVELSMENALEMETLTNESKISDQMESKNSGILVKDNEIDGLIGGCGKKRGRDDEDKVGKEEEEEEKIVEKKKQRLNPTILLSNDTQPSSHYIILSKMILSSPSSHIVVQGDNKQD